MLIGLDIENIAVIERASIEFENGLNVVTGETGAGKTLLINSLNMVLGSRTAKDLIREGADFARVSAVFFCNGIDSILEENNIPTDDGNVIISRKLYRDGRIRAIGISNFLPHHIDELLKTAEIVPMVNQIELQPGLNREADREYNEKLGIQVEAWAPFRIGESLTDPTVCAIAAKHGKTPAQVVLRWFLQNGIVPLPKSVTPERILSNIKVYDFELSAEDMAAINGIEQHSMRHDPDKIDF